MNDKVQQFIDALNAHPNVKKQFLDGVRDALYGVNVKPAGDLIVNLFLVPEIRALAQDPSTDFPVMRQASERLLAQ